MKFFRKILNTRKSTLHKYILYYLSVALLACALVGVSLFLVSANTLNETLMHAEAEKLTLVVNDLDAQFEAIQAISYSIRSGICYQQAYLSRSAFYEIALIEDLANYQNHSPILSDYFLFYEGDSNIFRRDGKSPFDLYARSVLGYPAGEVQALHASILAVNTSYQVLCLPGGDFLFVYPIRFNSSHLGNNRAWFCARITYTALMQRVDLVSGGFEGRISLHYGAPNPNDANALSAGAFTFSLVPPEESEYSEVLRFRKMCTWLSIGFTGLLVLVSLVLAYVSYLPIRRVVAHHSTVQAQSGSHAGDELAMLDSALAQAIRHRRLSEDQLESLLQQVSQQRRSLKEALLLALFHGEYSEKKLHTLREMSISLDGPWYMAAMLRLEKPVSPEGASRLIEAIESLSAEDAHYYAVQLDAQPLFAILVSTADAQQGSQLPDILQDIVEMELNQTPRTGCGMTITSLAQLSASLANAMAQTSPPASGSADAAQEDAFDGLTRALRQGNCAAALALLREMSDSLAARDATPTEQRCFYDALINRIAMLAREQGMPLAPERISALSAASIPDGCQRELPLVIAQLCERTARDLPAHADQRGAQIVCYIREHLLDYNLSLETVAEAFSLSGKQIGRLIARETGLSYKETLMEQRIERAKEMLMRGDTVSSVCEQLHYASLPYFIKLFREKTGFMPAKYKALHASSSSSH